MIESYYEMTCNYLANVQTIHVSIFIASFEGLPLCSCTCRDCSILLEDWPAFTIILLFHQWRLKPHRWFYAYLSCTFIYLSPITSLGQVWQNSINIHFLPEEAWRPQTSILQVDHIIIYNIANPSLRSTLITRPIYNNDNCNYFQDISHMYTLTTSISAFSNLPRHHSIVNVRIIVRSTQTNGTDSPIDR